MLTCPRESEIKQLLERGQWPAAAASDLRAHVDGCRHCRELVLVTQAFRQVRASSMATARPGSAGVLWWRAQLRRRNAAVKSISRPILGAQIFAFAITLVVAIGFIAWQVSQDAEWITWFKQLPQTASLQQISSLWSTDAAGSGLGPLLLISALAILALVGGVVVYLASERQQ